MSGVFHDACLKHALFTLVLPVSGERDRPKDPSVRMDSGLIRPDCPFSHSPDRSNIMFISTVRFLLGGQGLRSFNIYIRLCV